MTSLSIIVPTYCEADNLSDLVRRIDHAVQMAGISTEIIIVDDNSPDATRDICAAFDFETPVNLIVRTDERGLSSAVIRGMDEASGEVLLVMDADLSHPPEQIPAIFTTVCHADTDFVIGSRYVAGGSTAEDWGFFRWLNSKAATWLARPLTSALDPMAGFFSLKQKRYVEARSTLDPIGYKIGLELIVKCGCRGVQEVPIHFSDRAAGESKLSLKEQLNYLRHLKRLYEYRFAEVSKLSKFLLVGATGLAVDLSAFSALIGVTSVPVARAAAIAVAMTWNFVLNRHFTFGVSLDQSVTGIVGQYLRFCCSCLLGALVNWTVGLALMHVLPESASVRVLAVIAGVAAGTGFNYALCRHFVFNAVTRNDVAPGRLRKIASLFIPNIGRSSQSRSVQQASVPQ